MNGGARLRGQVVDRSRDAYLYLHQAAEITAICLVAAVLIIASERL